MKFLWHYAIILLIAGFLFCSCSPSPESNQVTLSTEDSLLISKWKSESRTYYSTNQDSFANIQLQIAATYKQAGQLGNWLNCYDTIIRSYRRHDQLEKAISYFEKLYKDIWQEPVDSFSLITLAESNRQIGYIYYNIKSEYAKALPFYDEGIRLITKANGWDPEGGRTFYKAAGNCSARMDDYEKAIVYHRRNVQLCREFKDTTNLFKGLNDLGIPYQTIGQFAEAEKAFRESYVLASAVDSVEQQLDGGINLVSLFTEQGKMDSALKYNGLCFDLLKRWKNKEADTEADVYKQQGELFSLQKKYADSEKSFAQAIQLMGQSDEYRRRECGKIYVEFGAMLLAQNKEHQALQKFQSALNCFIPEFKNDDVTITPDSLMLYDENGLFESCEGKGDANMGLFQKTNDKKYLADAALNYRAARIVRDKRELGMENESSRVIFNELVADIIHKSKVADSLVKVYHFE